MHVRSVSYWKHRKNERICLLLSGCVCRLCVHLRSGATYVFASQDSRLPGQYLLGGHHCWASFVHPSFLPVPTCETTHVQLGKIKKNIHHLTDEMDTHLNCSCSLCFDRQVLLWLCWCCLFSTPVASSCLLGPVYVGFSSAAYFPVCWPILKTSLIIRVLWNNNGTTWMTQ